MMVKAKYEMSQRGVAKDREREGERAQGLCSGWVIPPLTMIPLALYAVYLYQGMGILKVLKVGPL